MQVFFVMHENTKIAVFQVEDGTVREVKLNEGKQKYYPIGVRTIADMKHWIMERGIPTTRQRLSVELQALNISSPFEFMLNNYGLSLTDHYWLCDISSEYTWETVNLYQNTFVSGTSLDLRDNGAELLPNGRKNLSPNASLKGDLKKRWVIDSRTGQRALIKGNARNTCRQSLAEVFASRIHEMQAKFPYVRYSLIRTKSDNQNIIGCRCLNFTDINTEFIPGWDIFKGHKQSKEVSTYEAYLQYCLLLGLDLRNFMEYQILTDFLISNTDRHFNNFGVIRDTRTLQFISPAPIFDSGNSLFYNESYVPVGKALLGLGTNSFRTKEVNLLSYVKSRGLIDLSRLPSEDDLHGLLKLDVNTRDEVNERIVRAYRQKIKYLSDFQNGADIWGYNYGR